MWVEKGGTDCIVEKIARQRIGGINNSLLKNLWFMDLGDKNGFGMILVGLVYTLHYSISCFCCL